MNKSNHSSSNNLENIYWYSELYRECCHLETSIETNISDFFGVDMFELDADYQEAYEGILFALVCELGGHKGHFEYLHLTDCVYQYVNEGGTAEEFIAVIKEIVDENCTVGESIDKIKINDAIVSLKKEIKDLRTYMSEAITTITGNAQAVSFERFEPLLKFISKKELTA